MNDWERKCKALSDDELHTELIRMTNDGYLIADKAYFNTEKYKNRHKAIWDELLVRGLAHR